MTENTQMNIDQVLKTFQRVNNAFTYEVWVPSLKRDVLFKEISTSQQKRILKSIVDSEVYNTEFIIALYHIIKENCADETVNIDDLTIIDKFFIALKMRSVSIGDDISVELESKTDASVKITSNINVTKLINKTKKSITLLTDMTHTYENYSIVCSVPNILTEVALERELRQGNEDIEINSLEVLRKNIGEKFIGDVSKYIKQILITVDGEVVTVDMNNRSFAERIQIIEQLPSRCIEGVLKFMDNVEKEIEKVSLYNGKFKHKNGEEELFEHKLSLNSAFFIPS